MNKKSIFQVVITVLLAVIAAALTIIVLNKAGIITCQSNVKNNTAEFHRGEEHAHVHGANCSDKHDQAEHNHKHDAKCADDHKHDGHKHDAKCTDKHDHAEHNHKH